MGFAARVSEAVKAIVTEVPCVAREGLAEMLVKVGAIVSMTRVLLAPSECAAPGAGSVSTALFSAPSRIVPPFSANEPVPT